jgi:tRNA pseudouridine32 synthase/23S rRNA pseudouridine746 synthase
MSGALPVRDGVGPSSITLPAGTWQTVLEFLADHFADIGAATWVARMQRGDVVAADGSAIGPQSAYRAGARLFYYRGLESETPIPFAEEILYHDDQLLVVDKPHFLPVAPTGRFVQQTLLVRLKRKLGLDFLVPIHRLDRETAGVVLFSTHPPSRAAYHALFQRREVEKTYEALAPARPGLALPLTYRSRLEPGEPFFRMQEVAGAPNAETRIELLETRGDLARYRLRPVTGRKHQLRVQMAALGLPIVNDPFYPRLLPDKGDDFTRPLQLLARAIAFTDPVTGAARRFESSRELVLPPAAV